MRLAFKKHHQVNQSSVSTADVTDGPPGTCGRRQEVPGLLVGKLHPVSLLQPSRSLLFWLSNCSFSRSFLHGVSHRPTTPSPKCASSLKANPDSCGKTDHPECFIPPLTRILFALLRTSAAKLIWLLQLALLSPPAQDPAAVWGSGRPLQGVQRSENPPGRPHREVLHHRNLYRRGESQPRQRQRLPQRPSDRPQTVREEGDEEGHLLLLTAQSRPLLLIFLSFSIYILSFHHSLIL